MKGRNLMNISVVGTGYVGLVTGVGLAEVGHHVTCIDVDETKIECLKKGKSPIYEPGLEELLERNILANRIKFTVSHSEGFKGADLIYIAVGTPQQEDGQADLSYVKQVAIDIAHNVVNDVIVVIKSTVPVGTNDWVKQMIQENLKQQVKVSMVSNPEFLREGSAVFDMFHGDRIVIGADNAEIFETMKEVYQPFGMPIYTTDIRSAEMIKYASNAFLATKISFINEIANICEKLGANVEDVATGMGMDQRIGQSFLKAGIGYGGSCFPKDTKALVQIAGGVNHDFALLKSVIEVNNQQRYTLLRKMQDRLGNLSGKRVALLGLAFKPNTDDMREAPSITIATELTLAGADIIAYDPIAIPNAKKILPGAVNYTEDIDEALKDADAVMILTEWEQVKKIKLSKFSELMKEPLVFDGRNCYSLEEIAKHHIEYYSVGRPFVKSKANIMHV